MSDQIWLEKYRPESLNEYINYEYYRPIIEKWISPFLKNPYEPTNKPFLILYGPPGYGKTTMAHCIFNYYDFESLECNASDTRNKLQLSKLIKTSKKSFNLNKNGTDFRLNGLILDELDGLTSSDNGGVETVINILYMGKKPSKKKNDVRYPVICTTNSIKEKKISKILKFGVLIEMKPATKENLFKLGKYISNKEKIPILQKQIRILVNKINDYRDIIIKLNNIHLDIYNESSIVKKKEKIKKIINLEDERKLKIKINNRSMNKIVEDIINNFNNYEKTDILNIIDSNTQIFYMILLTNYFNFKLDINTLKLIINLIYNSNIYLKLYKKNNNNFYDLQKYLNYINNYGIIYLLQNKIKKSKQKKKINYHTRFNDMKQNKSYYNSNLNNKFNINESLDIKIKKKILLSGDIIKKKDILKNDKILNNIIDIDILNIYKKLNYTSLNIKNTIYTKINKL